MMNAAEWLRLDLPDRTCLAADDLNREASLRGMDARWVGVQRGEKYRAVGIDLPDLRARIARAAEGFDRVHFAVGLDVERGNFVLGEECATPVYLGIRVHRGAQTINKYLHREIFDTSIDRLQRATDNSLLWRPRDQFWSVWAYVPTTVNGELLSGDAYRAFVVDQALKGHAAVANLWAGVAAAPPIAPLPPTALVAGGGPRRFTYRTAVNPIDETLNALGAEGWEAVGLNQTADGPAILLKREI